MTTSRPAPTTARVTTSRPAPTPARPGPQPVLTESEEEILFWDFRESIAGEPELDYPIFDKIPATAFKCDGKLNGSIGTSITKRHSLPDLNIENIGYYADEEARCQVFHVCSQGADETIIQNSFLCPNGTIFSQKEFACLWYSILQRQFWFC